MSLLNLNVTFNLYREEETMLCEEIVMLWDPYERFLWGTALTIAVICGIYFIHISRKRDVFNERIIMLGLASLLLGFTFSLFFTYIKVHILLHSWTDFFLRSFPKIIPKIFLC